MARRAVSRSTRTLRREYGRVFDQAAELIASARACDCGPERHGANLQDLNAAIDDMLPTRQRVGACHSLPPCDGTDLEDDLSDENLESILARLEQNYRVLSEEVVASPCDCANRTDIPGPRIPEDISDEERERRRLQELYGTPTPERDTSPPLVPSLMTLPAELRAMVWWGVVRPNNGVIRIVPHRLTERSFTQQLWSPVRTGGPMDHLERVFVPGPSVNDQTSRETWALLEERRSRRWPHGVIDNQFNLLRANAAIYWEAQGEFWLRVAADRLMFSFGPEVRSRAMPAPDGHVEYDGILAAHTFFETLIRDDPASISALEVDPNNLAAPMFYPDRRRLTLRFHGLQYLTLIRRVHLDLTHTSMGTNRQALAPDTRPNMTNSIRYLDDVLGNLFSYCTGLEHLSLAFIGWVPDVTQQPWVEGPPLAVFNPQLPPGVAYPSSDHWYNRLTQFRRRPLLRLRIRVTYGIGVAMPTLSSSMQRTGIFVRSLRDEMLTNALALGGNHIRIRNFDAGPPIGNRFTVEADDSWDPVTQTHSNHDWNQTDESGYG